MHDTTPEIRQMLAQGYRALRPEQRVRMCADLFESARLLIEASLPAGLDDIERRRRICRRLYGEALAALAFPGGRS
jgi:hypothetical protein